MPRQSHGRPVSQPGPSRPKKRKPQKGRGLHALQIAEKEVPDEFKIRRHRLGEIEDEADDGRSVKRRKVDDGSGDENGGPASDGEDMGEGPDGEKWHVMGEGGDSEEGEENDDSEIESDDAFGASDEEMGRFVGFRFRGSKKTRKEAEEGEGESDGEEQSEDESLGEDAVDLATAWDMDDQDEEEVVEERKVKTRKRVRQEESDDGSDDLSVASDGSADSDGDDEMLSDLSVSDAEDGDHTRLQSFVQSLSKKPEATQQSAPKSTKISAADLLQYVKDPVQRQSLKILQSSERKGPEVYKSGIPGRLAAPLPKRQQDRLDRSAAYDESKKELGKWVETVKQNRRAEHLSFPLIDPNDPVAHESRQLPSTHGKPMTDLEKKVWEIMVENGLTNDGKKGDGDAEREDEELEEQQVPFEVIQARRAELRKQRDLMFREEIRARRIKKIKSKAYRRIHRKERAKQALEQRADDVANGRNDSDEERERNDKRRAEERMGARHRESKWARGMKEAGKMKWDEGARGAMEDAARRDEELRRRIEGRDVEEDSLQEEEGTSEDHSSDEEGLALDNKLVQLSSEGTNGTSGRLGNMAFMQRAEAAKKARNDASIQEIKKQLNGGDDDVAGSAFDAAAATGRQKFGAKLDQPTKQPVMRPLEANDFEDRLSDDEFIGLDGEEGAIVVPAESFEAPANTTRHTATIAPSAKSAKPGSETPNRMANGPRKTKAVPADNATKQLLKRTAKSEAALDDYTSPSESEHENEATNLTTKGPISLAADIFAGDEAIAQDFAKEKQDLIVEEGDQIIDNGLPGWGSWTGTGISKKAQKRQQSKSLTTVKGVAPDKRQDAKLERVIICEKRIKKNGKYLASELPHPFESRQQYERSLRLPIGPEWTTKTSFQDATKPRVLLKEGMVVRPMARPQA